MAKDSLNILPDKFIKNYGYVPFKYFQHIMILIIILSYIYKKYIINVLNKSIYPNINKCIKNNHINIIIKALIALLPFFIIAWYDLQYRSFSMKNLNVTKFIPDIQINNILRLLGAYAIIQVVAQDLGVKTGNTQSDVTKLPVFDFILYGSTAYAITQDRSLSLLASLAYFQLKYFASSNTKDVCFD